MRFTTTVQVLRDLVGIARPIAKSGTVMPVLQGILFSADATLGEVHVQASNLNDAILARATVSVHESGQALIVSETLSKIIGTLPADGEVTLACSGNNATLKCGRFKATLRTLSVQDFPTTPEPGAVVAQVATSVFLDAATCAMAATAKDATDFKGSLRILIDGQQMRLLATDGTRLARWTEHDGITGTLDLVITRSSLAEAIRHIKAVNPEEVAIAACEGSRIVFTAGDRVFTTRILAFTYPNVEAVIPSSSDATTTCQREELIEALKLSLVVAGAVDIPMVRVTAGKHSIKLQSGATGEHAGDFDGEINASLVGEPGSFAINGSHLLDALRSLNVKTVTIGMQGSLKPIIIGMEADPRATILIAPINA